MQHTQKQIHHSVGYKVLKINFVATLPSYTKKIDKSVVKVYNFYADIVIKATKSAIMVLTKITRRICYEKDD